MPKIPLKFGLPDIDLPCGAGKTINPSAFAGHDLVVLFCPTKTDRAASELDDYAQHSAAFADLDAWVIAIADKCPSDDTSNAAHPVRAADPDHKAWTAFRNLTDAPEALDRSEGATFFFTRGGALHRHWCGSGHADEVLEELRTPSSEHGHLPRTGHLIP